jgi:HK97 family phage major capsid protein
MEPGWGAGHGPRPGCKLEDAALSLLEELRQRRTIARTAADAVLTRAQEETRDLTAEELAEFTGHVATQREVEDEIDRRRDQELAELRAAPVRQPGPDVPREPVLTREQSVYDWLQARGAFDQADQPLSFDRYLRGLATADWTGAPQERALAESTIGAGGALVPAPLSARVIDLARNRTVVFRAGAQTVPMTSQTLALARLTSEGTPAWKSENATITAADMVFDRVTFTARTLVRLITLSVELFEDADPSSEDVIANAFAGQMAVELDRVALLGTGTPPEPRGVLNQSGITSTAHGANGTVITNYDWWLDAIGAVRAAGFEPNAHIQAPRSSTSLSKLKEATTNAYMTPPVGLLPMLTTKSIPITLTVGTSTDTSLVFTADWSNLLVGIRTDFRLRFLGERYLADNLQYAFLAYLRADVQLAQPTAFVVDTGVRT